MAMTILRLRKQV